MATASVRLQQAFDDLVAGFLVPLLSGGTVQLGRPIAPAALEHFELARPSDSDAEWRALDALHAAASAVAPLRAQPRLDRATLALTIACHDLLFLTDPELAGWPARRARPVLERWIDQAVALAGLPATRTDVLVRHAIVSRVLDVERRDVVVKNWAYTYRFFGRPVPPRVVALPRLRFVSQTESQLDLAQILAADGDERTPRLRAVVACSPLTELLRWRVAASITVGPGSSAVLSDPVLRGAVARTLASDDQAEASQAWSAALVRLSEASSGPTAPAVAYYTLALLFEAHVFAALDRDDRRRRSVGSGAFAAVLPVLLGTALGATLLTPRPVEAELVEARSTACRSASDEPSARMVWALAQQAQSFVGAQLQRLEAGSATPASPGATEGRP